MDLVSRLLRSLQHGGAPKRASDCPFCFLPKPCGAKHFLPVRASARGAAEGRGTLLGREVPEDMEMLEKCWGNEQSWQDEWKLSDHRISLSWDFSFHGPSLLTV